MKPAGSGPALRLDDVRLNRDLVPIPEPGTAALLTPSRPRGPSCGDDADPTRSNRRSAAQNSPKNHTTKLPKAKINTPARSGPNTLVVIAQAMPLNQSLVC